MSLQNISKILNNYANRGELTLAKIADEAKALFLILQELPFGLSIQMTQPTISLKESDRKLIISDKVLWGSLNDVVATITITPDGDYKYMAALALQLPDSTRLEIPGIDWFSLDKLTYIFQTQPYNYYMRAITPPVITALGATVHVKSDKSNTSIPIKVTAMTGNSLLLQGDFSSIDFPSLNDILAVLGNSNGVNLPTTLNALTKIALYDVSLEFDPVTPKVLLTGIEVGNSPNSTHGWDIISGILTFNNYRLRLTIADPLGSRSIGGLISAQLTLDDIPIEVYALHPISGGWDFKGETGKNYPVQIGKLITWLGKKFGTTSLPSAMEDFTISNLTIAFNTQSNDFTFACKGMIPLADAKTAIDGTLLIEITQQQDRSYKKHFDGHITIGGLKFALIFDTERTSKTFLAAYHSQQTVSIKQLIGSIDPTLQNNIPEGLKISLKDALFAYSQKVVEQKKTTNFLFGLNIGSGINLSNLPLVGKEFPPKQTIKLSYQVLVTKLNFTADEIKNLNKLYPEGGISLPEGKAITNRLDLATSMQIGNETRQLSLPVAINQNSGQLEERSQPTTTPPPRTTTPDGTQWFTLQKAFGPVHFERIGLKYQKSNIWFLLDAGFSFSGLTLSLDGLSVHSPLTKFEPKFDLKGLGIDYKGGDALEIGGAFLRKQVTKDGKTYEEYDGAAIIKAETFSLSAIGSYAQYKGHPSLFIYAILDYPLGGPAFFFVTGLAAGFGYNRALKVPTINRVATFPLVEEAVNPNSRSNASQDSALQLTQELDKLQQYIPPETGQIFLAVGVKFTSFKTIDSFVLLTVAFGNRFELNILGLSTLIAPPEVGTTPVAEMQLALKATFIPSDGFLGVRAQLTSNSYILSKACHLTGGFAFYSWFAPNKYEGDFVLTIGGYHPQFKVPAHYPKVPRLGLNWQVNNQLHLKANAYFALTASVLMAGGHLQATWNSGALRAWFNAGADFIIAWKPYHYDAAIYINMGVFYTFQFFGTHHITVDLGADLHIWGPEFTGIAHIHLWIISFTVRFGSSQSTLKAIDWKEFRNSFLPKDDEICTVVVKEGLVRKVNQNDKSDLGVINPKHFSLVTNSVIPATDAEHETKVSNFQKIGIGSMAVKSGEITSTHTITITKDGAPVKKDFAYIPIRKKAPTGLWGESIKPDLNGKQFIENTLSGFEIKPKKTQTAGQTHAINRSQLQLTTDSIKDAYKWKNIPTFIADTQKEPKQTINNTIMAKSTNRNNLLKNMGITSSEIEEINLSQSIANDFLISPQIEKVAA